MKFLAWVFWALFGGIKIRSISKEQLWEALGEFTRSPSIALLFGGDRLECCDEVLAAYTRTGCFLGAVSLAPEGEQYNGQPAIVGIWVHPNYRRTGIGQKLQLAAVKRMDQRGLTPVTIDALSEKSAAMLRKLPPRYRKLVEVHDCGVYVDEILDR